MASAQRLGKDKKLGGKPLEPKAKMTEKTIRMGRERDIEQGDRKWEGRGRCAR